MSAVSLRKIIIVIISLAVFRVMPGQVANFSPLMALALFCGTYFKRGTALAFTLMAIWLSDVLMSHLLFGHWVLFYPGCFWQYSGYLLIAGIGMLFLRQIKPIRIMLAGLGAAVLFYTISNFGVWYSGLLYPMTLTGLMACYVAAIPFFKTTLISTWFFSILLFSAMEYKSFNLSRLNHA